MIVSAVMRKVKVVVERDEPEVTLILTADEAAALMTLCGSISGPFGRPVIEDLYFRLASLSGIVKPDWKVRGSIVTEKV